MNGEDHINDISFMTTLAGYVHWKLTGQKVVGIGEASGVFPIDPVTQKYNLRMLQQFSELTKSYNIPWKVEDILPDVLVAGEKAGELTKEGAQLLDVTGELLRNSFCPPEGDADTGMTATNSVAAAQAMFLQEHRSLRWSCLKGTV